MHVENLLKVYIRTVFLDLETRTRISQFKRPFDGQLRVSAGFAQIVGFGALDLYQPWAVPKKKRLSLHIGTGQLQVENLTPVTGVSYASYP